MGQVTVSCAQASRTILLFAKPTRKRATKHGHVGRICLNNCDGIRPENWAFSIERPKNWVEVALGPLSHDQTQRSQVRALSLRLSPVHGRWPTSSNRYRVPL